MKFSLIDLSFAFFPLPLPFVVSAFIVFMDFGAFIIVFMAFGAIVAFIAFIVFLGGIVMTS